MTSDHQQRSGCGSQALVIIAAPKVGRKVYKESAEGRDGTTERAPFHPDSQRSDVARNRNASRHSRSFQRTKIKPESVHSFKYVMYGTEGRLGDVVFRHASCRSMTVDGSRHMFVILTLIIHSVSISPEKQALWTSPSCCCTSFI